jgi:hypothetical protein
MKYATAVLGGVLALSGRAAAHGMMVCARCRDTSHAWFARLPRSN